MRQSPRCRQAPSVDGIASADKLLCQVPSSPSLSVKQVKVIPVALQENRSTVNPFSNGSRKLPLP